MCLAGYISRTGLKPCFPCPRGYFQPRPGKSSCFLCPGNVNTISDAATDISDCEGLTMMEDDYEVIPTSELVINECFKSPCINNATCESSGVGLFVCHCIPGWTGVYCEIEIDECSSNPCHNNATCYDLDNSFSCDCGSGYEGEVCEVNIDECESDPCQHNSTCVDEVSSYRCECLDGYEGVNCEENEDDCRGTPCQYNGTCVDHVAAFTCNCVAGFTGELCEVNIEECNSSPCQNNASCLDMDNSFKCMCLAGYTGVHCEVEIDECVSSPCHPAATCLDLVSSYKCLCPPAYTGKHCQQKLNSTFDLYFPVTSVTNYIALDGFLPELAELTIAFWMRANYTGNYGTPFSYATDTEPNAMTINDFDGIVIDINGENLFTDVKVSDGHWHHMTFTWSSKLGDWAVYIDSILEHQGTDASKGVPIPGGGVVVLGQEQDARGSKFNGKESFVGRLSRLNIWNFTLSQEKIRSIFKTCDEIIGTVIAWPDFLAGIHGQVENQNSELCKDCIPPPNITSGMVSWNGTSTGDLVTYSCIAGHLVSGDPHRRCGVASTWNSSEPKCERVKCAYPETVMNSRMKSLNNTYGGYSRYECLKGFRLEGNDTLYCNVEGKWEGTIPKCTDIMCPKPPRTPNIQMYPRHSLYSPGTVVQFSCLTGYSLNGSRILKCLDNGNWSDDYPFCEKSICGIAPNISNGHPREPERVYFGGDFARYICNPGFSFHQSGSSVKCLPRSKWATPPTCKIKYCTKPSHIPNAIMHSTTYAFNSTVRYACKEGYTLVGNEVIRCSSSLKWIGSVPKCVAIKCPSLETFAHGTIVLESNLFNSTAVYKCNENYVMKGPYLRHCTSNGTWSESPPVCEAIRCMAPEPVQHGTVIGDEFFFGNYANYSCNPGYVLIGEPDRRCGQMGKWVNDAPTCAHIECSQLHGIDNGKMIGSSFYYNDTVEFICDADHRLQGSKVLTCLQNTSWSADIPHCEKIRCVHPSPITNGEYLPLKDLVPGSVIKYSCDMGYEGVGKNSRTCKSDGSWTGPNPKCKEIRCLYPKQIQHGKFVAQDNTYGSNISYVCDEGFEPQGDSSRTCTMEKIWNGTSPECMEKKCEPPPEIPHGKHIGENYTVGAKVRYKCEPGYKPDPDEERLCLDDKTWSGENVTCSPISCTQPPEIIHGRMVGEYFTYNSTIHYQCDVGYYIDGLSTRLCQADGNWLNPEPKCERVICPLPQSPNNTHLLTKSEHRYEDKIQYECLKGYNLHNDGERTCSANGTWTGEEANCTRIECDPLQSPANGDIEIEGFLYLDSVVYSCKQGYEIKGDALITCESDGEWSGSQATCTPIRCEKPPAVDNADISFDQIRAGDVVQYVCKPGFYIVQDVELLCTDNGNYTGDLPTCQRFQCKSPVKPEHGDVKYNGSSYGDYVDYICDEGYKLIGISRNLCNVHGRWGNDAPICEPVTCPSLSPTLHGSYKEKEIYQFKDNVTFLCEEGFEISGQSIIICESDAGWSSDQPSCERVKCPEPVVSNGFVAQTSRILEVKRGFDFDEIYFFGDTIEFECEEGYELEGHSSVACQHDKTWSNELPQCLVITCPEPNITNAIIKAPLGFTYKNRILISCMEGYTLDGKSELYCQPDQTWSDDEPTCNIVTCDDPFLKQGSFFIQKSPRVGYGYPFMIVIEFNCDAGYYLKGADVVTCQSSGEWSDEFPVCEMITCDPPELAIPHAPKMKPVKVDYSFAESVMFSCESGYKLEGEEKISCIDGNWNSTLPSCTLIECTTPDIPHSNLRILGTNVVPSATTKYLHNTVVRIDCALGFSLKGQRELLCQENGTWSSSSTSCHPVTCPIPNVLNGYVEGPRGDVPDFGVGVTVPIYCHKGYTIQENFKITCLPSGKWSNQSVICSMITCRAPEIEGGTIISKRANGHIHFTVDDTIRIICHGGYTLKGEGGLLKCTADGDWSEEIPHCSEVQCPELKIDHGTVLATDKALSESRTGQFVYRDEVEVKCDEGYRLAGKEQLECTATATWSTIIPTCQPIICVTISIENGVKSTEETSFGTVVTIECMLGYEIFGDTDLTCKGQGEWSGVMPICAMIECQTPKIQHGKIMVLANESNILHFGSVVSFQCDEGYSLQGEKETLCMPNSSWSEDPPVCQKITCKTPPLAIDYGDVNVIKPDGDDSFSYGTVLQYECDQGYGIHGEAVLMCTSSGQWTSDFSVCVVNVCEYPAIENGYAHGSSSGDSGEYIFGDTVRFKCKPGFELLGSPEMFCQPDGKWTDPFPHCERIECPEPKQILNGTYQGTTRKFGDTVNYKCDKGFQLVGSPNVTCLSDGKWSEIPSCSMIICELPPEVEHGRYIALGLLYGDKIRYACHAGYELVGEAEHECEDDRAWSGTIPICMPVQCADPIPPLLNGNPLYNLQEMGDMNYQFGDKVYYECTEGYTREGLSYIECASTGIWTKLATKCNIISCEQPPHIENGRLIDGKHVYGYKLEYKCNEGYIMEGASKIWCTAMGIWNGTAPQCTPIYCGMPSIPSHGVLKYGDRKLEKVNDFDHLVPDGFRYDDKIDYSCDNGYELDGVNKLQCLANGSWSADFPKCVRITCVSPPAFRDGRVNGTQGRYGDSLNVICITGYWSRNRDYITCKADKTWNVFNVNCQRKVCKNPQRPLHGKVIGGPYIYNFTVEYHCNEGYLLNGDHMHTCLETKEWSGSTPTCDPVKCKELSVLHHGYFKIDAGTKLQFGAAVEFGCDEGYELKGNNMIECLATGKWSGSLPRCAPVLCEEPDAIDNGNILSSLVHEYKAVIEYTCVYGYRLSGEPLRHCLANKTWSGHPPECIKVACDKPPDIPNGKIRGSRVTYNGIAIYECDDMYELVGRRERQCQGDGTWSGSAPECHIKVCPHPPKLWHGKMLHHDYSAGSTVQFQCDEGYIIFGDEELVCLGEEWSSPYPSCRKITCGQPEMIEYGTIHGDSYTYLSKLAYKCLGGYNLQGNGTVECLSDGRWSELTALCKPVTCGEPPDVANTYVLYEDTTFGHLAHYGCNEGYEMYGSNIVECVAEGTWKGILPTCKMISCGVVPVIHHASVLVTRSTYKSKAMYTCNKGYILNGSAMIECMANGTWMYMDKPTCYPEDCGRPPSIQHGGFKGAAFTLGNVVKYYCLEGYVMYGHSSIQCSYGGQWNLSVPECFPVNCSAPEPPKYGNIQGDIYAYGNDILYQCDTGYHLVGNVIRTCMPDGTWGGQEPRCDLIYCEPVYSPDNGNLTLSDRRHFNSLAVFSCADDYKLVGYDTLVCLESGSWNGTEPVCELIVPESEVCPQPALPEHVVPINAQFSVGDSIMLTCEHGYQATDTMAITCQDDLTWTKSLGHCERVSCGPPPEGPWVIFMGTSTYQYGDKLMYVCRNSLTAGTHPVMTCGTDGHWDITPKCIATCKFDCKNGGSCVGQNICKCQPGYVGRFCSQAICVLPCLHGGKCTAPYHCMCRYGFAGARCEKPICVRPCENGGVCVAPNRCYCPHGFKPPFCERYL